MYCALSDPSSAGNQDSNVYLRHRISRVQTPKAGGNSFHPRLIYMSAIAHIYKFDYPCEGRWIGIQASNILVTSSSDLSTCSLVLFLLPRFTKHLTYTPGRCYRIPGCIRQVPESSLHCGRFLTFYHSVDWKRQETRRSLSCGTGVDEFRKGLSSTGQQLTWFILEPEPEVAAFCSAGLPPCRLQHIECIIPPSTARRPD